MHLLHNARLLSMCTGRDVTSDGKQTDVWKSRSGRAPLARKPSHLRQAIHIILCTEGCARAAPVHPQTIYGREHLTMAVQDFIMLKCPVT